VIMSGGAKGPDTWAEETASAGARPKHFTPTSLTPKAEAQLLGAVTPATSKS
jgi:hypothetical protein